jgi:hypothetical protein
MKKLVDAESILSYIEHLKNSGLGKSRSLKYLTEYIECMSHAYDVDKVIEQLEDLVKINMEVLGVRADYVNLAHVIKIVKAGGIDE